MVKLLKRKERNISKVTNILIEANNLLANYKNSYPYLSKDNLIYKINKK